MLRRHFTNRGVIKHKIQLAAFKRWNTVLAPAKRSSRVVDKVTKITIDDDVLDSPLLNTEEKCSGYRYIVYRFPTSKKLSVKEQRNLSLIMKQDLSETERATVICTLKEVHARDKLKRDEDTTTNALLSLSTVVWHAKKWKPKCRECLRERYVCGLQARCEWHSHEPHVLTIRLL